MNDLLRDRIAIDRNKAAHSPLAPGTAARGFGARVRLVVPNVSITPYASVSESGQPRTVPLDSYHHQIVDGDRYHSFVLEPHLRSSLGERFDLWHRCVAL
jgi:hypothetical protein